MDTKYESYEVWTWPFLGTDLVCWRCALFCWSECAGRAGFMMRAAYPGTLDPPDCPASVLTAVLAVNAAANAETGRDPVVDRERLGAALRLASGAA